MLGNCRKSILVLLVGLTLALPSVVVAADDPDPYESLNRKIFAFNEFSDRWFLKPVARGYRWITPYFVDDAVTRVFGNLAEISNFTNSALQGDLSQSGESFTRFVINSTIGVAGIFDVATGMGLEQHKEDFGQTFGVWGIESGPYIVLPFLGPSSMRDAFSTVPDIYLSPVTYIDHVPTRNSTRATGIIDGRADLMDIEQLVTGDRYTFLRDIYLQTREADVLNGDIEDDFDSDF